MSQAELRDLRKQVWALTDANEDLLNQFNSKNKRIRQLEAELGMRPRKRLSYPRDHPRDEKGRITGTCPRCKIVDTTIVARGLCRACYDSERYLRGLGSIPPQL